MCGKINIVQFIFYRLIVYNSTCIPTRGTRKKFLERIPVKTGEKGKQYEKNSLCGTDPCDGALHLRNDRTYRFRCRR